VGRRPYPKGTKGADFFSLSSLRALEGRVRRRARPLFSRGKWVPWSCPVGSTMPSTLCSGWAAVKSKPGSYQEKIPSRRGTLWLAWFPGLALGTGSQRHAASAWNAVGRPRTLSYRGVEAAPVPASYSFTVLPGPAIPWSAVPQAPRGVSPQRPAPKEAPMIRAG
jgi:hypothetical protein